MNETKSSSAADVSLTSLCKAVREDVLNMVYQAGSGHLGASLSAVEILVALYGSGLFRCDPQSPDWPRRDRLILSKGHAVPALYSVLCHRGFFPRDELAGLRQLGRILQGHPNVSRTPGIDCSSGSLGQGLSIANGMAWGLRRQNNPGRVYCVLGDGELQEGQIWEAALTAAHHKLANVCAIVDNNRFQLDGPTDFVKKMEPLADKWRSFGWQVCTVDGHNHDQLLAAYNQARNNTHGPTVILADTIKGKGVSFMENNCEWHSNPPTQAQWQAALAEILAG